MSETREWPSAEVLEEELGKIIEESEIPKYVKIGDVKDVIAMAGALQPDVVVEGFWIYRNNDYDTLRSPSGKRVVVVCRGTRPGESTLERHVARDNALKVLCRALNQYHWLQNGRDGEPGCQGDLGTVVFDESIIGPPPRLDLSVLPLEYQGNWIIYDTVRQAASNKFAHAYASRVVGPLLEKTTGIASWDDAAYAAGTAWLDVNPGDPRFHGGHWPEDADTYLGHTALEDALRCIDSQLRKIPEPRYKAEHTESRAT
jgi:hypothetical protein